MAEAERRPREAGGGGGLGDSPAFTNVALEGDGDGDSSGSDLDPQEQEERQRRRQEMETDQLDPREKAAHEADTLPVGAANAPKDAKEGEVKKGDGSSGGEGGSGFVRHAMNKAREGKDWLAARTLTSRNPLPPDPSRTDLAKHALRCPPHGRLAKYASLPVLVLVLWLSCLAALGPIAAAPNGTIFLLIVLVVLAMLAGELVALASLPPLLGMLLAGIVLKNLPGVEVQEDWTAWSSALRSLALTIILMRAGLGLDPQALKRLSAMVFRLAFSPCLAETLTVAIASHLLLGFPWLWGFMLGFVLAAVSPAVVVPCLLQLQEKGYGVAKGIPTLVIAAASVDDVLAISGFTVLLGVTFKPDLNFAAAMLRGPAEFLIGLLVGIAWGGLVVVLPGRDDKNYAALRFVFLLGGGIIALFGSKSVHVPGAGPLAVLVMAFVAGVGWRWQGWTDEQNEVSKYLSKMWFVFQPVLFGLIGTEIQIDKLDGHTIGLGILVLLVGLLVRVAVTFLVVGCGNLNLKERIFVSLAWLPKATVQAAIGPVAYDQARQMVGDHKTEYEELGLQVLTIAVLVILITAPIGAAAIMLWAPRLLEKSGGGVNAARSQDAEAAEGASQKSQ